jgi:hypothetical protein
MLAEMPSNLDYVEAAAVQSQPMGKHDIRRFLLPI